MSPASKFVNAKKGGKNSSHGCVRARANRPRRIRDVGRPRFAFHEKNEKKRKTDDASTHGLHFDSQMHALAVGGQLQARCRAEAAWGVTIRRSPVSI